MFGRAAEELEERLESAATKKAAVDAKKERLKLVALQVLNETEVRVLSRLPAV